MNRLCEMTTAPRSTAATPPTISTACTVTTLLIARLPGVSRFVTDTAVAAVGPGRYAASIDRGWWIERGPNGGYLAAIVLRAVVAEVDDRARRPRSLTLHYLRPPVEGPVRGHRHARASRARPHHGIGPPHPGRPRLHPGAGGPGGRPARPRAPRPPGTRGAVARGRTGRSRPRRRRARHPVPPSLRGASGPRHPALQLADPSAETGGWIRTADHDVLDDVLLAAITDSWPPAVFSRLQEPARGPHDRAHRALPRANRRATRRGASSASGPGRWAPATSRRAGRCGRRTADCWPTVASSACSSRRPSPSPRPRSRCR